MTNELHVKTELIIKQKADIIWSIMTNGRSFPEWNPMVRKMEGDFIPGESAKVYFKSAVGLLLPFNIDTKIADGRQLRWIGSQFGIRGNHYFKLSELSENETRLNHGMLFEGTLLPIAAGIIRMQTQKSFTDFNLALRHQAEGLAVVG